MRRTLLFWLVPLLGAFIPQHTLEPAPHTGLEAAGTPRPRVGSMSLTWVCGSSDPWTLRGAWKDADAIARVRVDSQFAYDHFVEFWPEPIIQTELEMTVLEVFKSHPHAVGAGASLPISHPGGTLMRADGEEMHETNGFAPPTNGTEWFLFLRWDEREQRFWINYLEDGALQVVGGDLVPVEAASLTTWLRAQMGAEALAERLRALAGRLREGGS